MAFDAKPSSLFASWSEDAVNITLPIASVTELTAAEADGTTGNWRDVMYRLIDHTFGYYDGLATADKPGKFSMTRSRSEAGDGTLRFNYNITINVDSDATSVTAE